MHTSRSHTTAQKLTTLALVAVIVFAMAPLWGTPRSASAGPPANAVVDWNLYASEALFNAPTATTVGAGQSPLVGVLYLAMMQGAIYDAVNMIDGSYQPYLAGLPAAPPWASTSAAVATAAHDVLVGVVIEPPLAQAIVDRLDGYLNDSLAAATSADGPDAVAAGIAAGETAAAAMLASRADDGRYVPYALTPGTEPGQWRPELPSFVSDPFAWVAFVDPFMLESPDQFRTKGPNALTSGRYTKEYNEVKALGRATGSTRTAEQEALAQFYNVNPTELYNRTFRTIAAAEGLTVVEQARLFAMLNLTVADTMINCWNEKAYWSFWRPITAIRNGDTDGNPHTIGDPTWTPLYPTPPYSDHASGYNCGTAAFMHTAKAFFGTNRMDFSIVKIVPGVPNVTREYHRFTDVINDTIDARVYLGFHFRTADVQGAELGEDVADWMVHHYFQPVGTPKHTRITS